MKLRFGIREKFALMVIVMVLAAAWGVPRLLFHQTRQLVTDHEIGDLRDEAALRCWEMTEAVSNLRVLTNDVTRDEKTLRRLLECTKRHETKDNTEEPGWWLNVECVVQMGADGKLVALYEAPGITQSMLPVEFQRSVILTAAPQVSRLLPLDLPSRPRWSGSALEVDLNHTRRVAGVWAGQRKQDGAGAVYLLMSLPSFESPRHLAFLLDGDGNYLMRAVPGKNKADQVGDPFQETDLQQKVRAAVSPSNKAEFQSKGAGAFNLVEALKAHSTDQDEGKFWRGAESNQQVQRGMMLEEVVLKQPFYFLEGRATDSFKEVIREQERKQRNLTAAWFSDLHLECQRTGWHMGTPQEGARELRMLGNNEEGLKAAKLRLEIAMQKKFSTGYAVNWDEPVKCQLGDLQLMRFFLRQSDKNDPPYWFGYCAFRDELAASINHEMKELSVLALWLSGAAGVMAFLLAFWMVSPLIRITKTAQSVAGSPEDALQNRIETVRRSLPNKRKDEVGDISQALDRLLVEVLNGHERLRQMNADLEKRVSSRTRDLQEANDQLKGLAAAKDTFLASVSHELRQPLNSIFGFLQFLEFSELTPQQHQDVEKVRHAASYLKGLIDDILDYQKIIMGGITLEPEQIEPKQFFGQLQASLESQAKEKNNKLTFIGVDEISVIRNDRQRLQQVLVNLLTNACKFTENGEVTLKVRRESVTPDPANDFLLIDVSDTGRGMKPEEKDALFVQFKKLSSREGNRSGTGLGLVISKGLCDMMGGAITVESEFGKGSTFTVRIPASIAAEGEVIDSKVIPASGTGHRRIYSPPPGVAGRKVLVIDDDEAVRELVGRYLREEGCTVFEAADGDEGIEMAKLHKPHLITLDVVMPGRDGWDTLAQLKSDPETAEIAVVLMTFLEQAGKGYALGATDYIVKPIDWDRLGHILRQHTGGESPILVVDDDAAVREIARRTLEQDGWKVMEAANGVEACALMEKETPAVILLDLMMPEMDGFEFLSTMRNDTRWQQIPVIVVTAMHLTTNERKQLAGSVSLVLEKNCFSLDALLAEVLRCASITHPIESDHGKNPTR